MTGRRRWNERWRRWCRRTLSVALSAVLSLTACSGFAFAGLIRFEGFYEFKADVNQEAGNFSPNIQADGSTDRGAKNYFQGRVYGNPVPDADFFSKFELDSKGDDKYRYAEGHMFLRKSANNKTAELILFDGQGRLAMNEPLLEITSGNSDLRGMRANFYAWNGWMHLYQGRFKSANEDVFAFRTGKNFFSKNRLSVGTTALRKAWTAGYADVGGMDVILRFSEAELITAGSVSYTTNYAPGRRTLFQSELKNLRLSSTRLGSVRMTSAYRDWGAGYRNYIGKNPEKKEKGIYNELTYELPFKALRLTWRQDMKRETRSNVFSRPERRTNYWYTELFMDFRKGYKAKFSYDQYNDPWNSDITRPSVLGQVESYSKFNTFKAQLKYKDYGNRFQKTIFGIENNHNLTQNVYFLIRALHAFEDQGDISRNSVFVQMRYRVRDNGNVIVEFGNSGYGSNDLANDGSFADNSTANTDRITKLLLQLWW